jgi:hypothetical protein
MPSFGRPSSRCSAASPDRFGPRAKKAEQPLPYRTLARFGGGAWNRASAARPKPRRHPSLLAALAEPGTMLALEAGVIFERKSAPGHASLTRNRGLNSLNSKLEFEKQKDTATGGRRSPHGEGASRRGAGAVLFGGECHLEPCLNFASLNRPAFPDARRSQPSSSVWRCHPAVRAGPTPLPIFRRPLRYPPGSRRAQCRAHSHRLVLGPLRCPPRISSTFPSK